MVITNEYTIEYVYDNIKLNETRIIIENTLLEYHQKYGYNYNTEVEVKCIVKFFDKIENETKNIIIEHENIIGKVNKIMQSSKGMNETIKALELTIRIEGRIHKNTVNAYMNCDKVQILWKRQYARIGHDRY